MNNDTKHVLTILGFVGCFGAGYFVCKAENSDILKIGNRFSVFTEIEKTLDLKSALIPENNEDAIKNAVNAYYQTNDKYFYYSNSESNNEAEISEKYDYSNQYRINDDIAYINSGDFYMEGIQGFTKFFRNEEETAVKGFIIDLRENRGGMTDYCVSSLGYFIEPCEVVKYYYNDGKTENEKIINENVRNENVVILVNEHTASSAEIFASAMKQFYSGEVTIIGTQTKGKGCFQEHQGISDTESIKYTAGLYTVGTWQCYDGVGITPDIEIEMEYDPEIICTDEDIQLNTAIEFFNN